MAVNKWLYKGELITKSEANEDANQIMIRQ